MLGGWEISGGRVNKCGQGVVFAVHSCLAKTMKG